MPYADASDGTRIHYFDWGAGETVVLIHGWPVDADMWEYQASWLAERGHRVIAHDRRGFGRSDAPWGGYDYDTMAGDLAAVLDHADVDRATLVGFSMGGGEVVRYLARHGDGRVRGAVLVSAVPPFLLRTADNPEGVEGSVFDGMIASLEEDRPHFLAQFARNFYGVGVLSKPVSNEILAWQQGLALRASPRATRQCVRAFGETDFRADLAAVKVPTLVIHGSDDAIVPREVSGRRTAQIVAGASEIVYDGAPHGLYVTHKQRLAQDILTFVRGR